jgi:hypothetical protein
VRLAGEIVHAEGLVMRRDHRAAGDPVGDAGAMV